MQQVTGSKHAGKTRRHSHAELASVRFPFTPKLLALSLVTAAVYFIHSRPCPWRQFDSFHAHRPAQAPNSLPAAEARAPVACPLTWPECPQELQFIATCCHTRQARARWLQHSLAAFLRLSTHTRPAMQTKPSLCQRKASEGCFR